jgi:hypothetical protein
MTAQFPDTFLLNDREFSIVGVRGGELFDPQSIGVKPVPTCSACWRGYVCQYSIKDNKLILDTLRISLGYHEGNKFLPQRGPQINGVQLIIPNEKHMLFDNLYERLDLNVQFTGGVLLGDGFIRELYVHMGFHPAWKYNTVFGLIFDNGTVVEIRDVSSQIKELRNMMVSRPLEPDSDAGGKEIESWIESTFKLDYDL